MSTTIKILPFRNKHQAHVSELLLEVLKEFNEPITSESSVPMKQVAHVIGNQFWVAMNETPAGKIHSGGVLVGTIGLIRFSNKKAALKSFFVSKDHRGGVVADLLLQKLLSYAKRKSIEAIYLGTMEQMKGAHRFYEKKGFIRINENELPKNFPKNPLDKVFYELKVR